MLLTLLLYCWSSEDEKNHMNNYVIRYCICSDGCQDTAVAGLTPEIPIASSSQLSSQDVELKTHSKWHHDFTILNIAYTMIICGLLLIASVNLCLLLGSHSFECLNGPTLAYSVSVNHTASSSDKFYNVKNILRVFSQFTNTR